MDSKEKTWAEKAREVSNLSPEACAVAIGRSRPVYDQKEQEPGKMTIDQVVGLSLVYNEAGKNILRDYLHSIAR